MRDIFSLRSSVWFRLSVGVAWSYVAWTYLYLHLSADGSGGTLYNVRTSQYGFIGEVGEVAIGLYALASVVYLYFITVIFWIARRRAGKGLSDPALEAYLKRTGSGD